MAPRAKNTSRTLEKRITISEAKKKSKGVKKTVAKKKRGVKWPLLAQGLFEWFHKQEGSISDSSIRLRANEIFQECYQDSDLPKFSDAWLKTWKMQYASYYDEQMLVAASKKIAISEPESSVGERSGTLSSNHPVATTIEPSNGTRIMKFVKVATTATTPSNDPVGPVDSEIFVIRRNLEAYNSNMGSSTDAETDILIGVPVVCRSFNQSATDIATDIGTDIVTDVATDVASSNQGQNNDRDGRAGSYGFVRIDRARGAGPILSVQGDEGEDRSRTRRVISQPRPTMVSTDIQPRVMSQTPEANTASRNTPAAPGRGQRAFGTWAFDVAEQVAPSFNLPVYDENERLDDTFIINSPSTPTAARPQGAGAFGTWAFDAEVQEAPGFIWPAFPDDESLASTTIIDY